MSTTSRTVDRNGFSGHHSHGIKPQEMLLNDLRSIIRDMTLGAVTITSHVVENGEGNVWFIRGPKKSPVVMLHYQHQDDPSLENDGKDGPGDSVTSPDSDGSDDDCKPSWLTQTTFTSGETVLNNCEVNERGLQSNFEVKSEVICDASVSCQQTSNVVIGVVQRPRVPLCSRPSETASPDSASAYSEQERQPSFFNAADDTFVVKCESPEVDLLSCRLISLEHQNEPESRARDKLESEIPIFDSTRIIKSEVADDTISCNDLSPVNDVDVQQLTSSSSRISHDDDVCRLNQSSGDLKTVTDQSLDDDELKPNITDIGAGFALKECSVVLQRLDAATLERHAATNRLRSFRATTSVVEVNTGNQFDQRCRYCAKVFRNLQILKFHEERRDCQEVGENCEQATKSERVKSRKSKSERVKSRKRKLSESVKSRKSKLPEINLTDFTLSQEENSTECTKQAPFFQCRHCKAMYSRYEHLTVHQKMHRREGYECPNCKLRFPKHNKLRLHQKSCSSVAERLQCPHCEAAFKFLAHLERHQRVHTGETHLRCSFCDKKFNNYEHKQVHETMHIRESVKRD